MIEFLQLYWRDIVQCLVLVVNVIFFLILSFNKNKGHCDIRERIIAQLPNLILAAEKKFGSGTGKEKKSFVMELVSDLYYKWTNLKLINGSKEYSLLNEALEDILSTPQKKGD